MIERSRALPGSVFLVRVGEVLRSRSWPSRRNSCAW